SRNHRGACVGSDAAQPSAGLLGCGSQATPRRRRSVCLPVRSPILGPPVTRPLLSRAVFIAESVILTVLITVGLQAFVVQPYRVEHVSMMDTLADGQMVLVDKLSPRIAGYG